MPLNNFTIISVCPGGIHLTKVLCHPHRRKKAASRSLLNRNSLGQAYSPSQDKGESLQSI